MARRFKIGDHVSWNSEAGRVSGTIIAIRTSDFDYKGHVHHASECDPQYEIKSDKTDQQIAIAGDVFALWPVQLRAQQRDDRCDGLGRFCVSQQCIQQGQPVDPSTGNGVHDGLAHVKPRGG